MAKSNGGLRHGGEGEWAGLIEKSARLPYDSIPEISGYLARGYWLDQGSKPRSWASTDQPVTFNLDNMSEEYKDLARLAFATWD